MSYTQGKDEGTDMNIGMENMNEKILLTIDIRFDSIQEQ